jgi:hypothetical protein
MPESQARLRQQVVGRGLGAGAQLDDGGEKYHPPKIKRAAQQKRDLFHDRKRVIAWESELI